MEDVVHNTMLKYTKGFVGCISDVTLATDYHIDLMAEVSEGQNILECSPANPKSKYVNILKTT
jgi:hypothetical protein